jgi:hypothetical protein
MITSEIVRTLDYYSYFTVTISFREKRNEKVWLYCCNQFQTKMKANPRARTPLMAACVVSTIGDR